MDYIPALVTQLESPVEAKRVEAQQALLFLNASVMAELDGNFSALDKLGVTTSTEFKRDTFTSRNAAQRDFATNSTKITDEFVNPENTMTIGELVEGLQQTKRKLRKQGKSIKEIRKAITPVVNEPKPLPVKIFNKQEISNLNKKRNGKK